MDIFELAGAPPTVLDQLPVDVLMNLHDKAKQHASDATRMVAIVHGVLERRYARGLNQTGATHVRDGSIDVVVTLPKRIKYDQKLLKDAVDTIKGWGEDPADYVETEIKVAESKYNAWPPSIRDLFTPARTVEAGKPTFEFRTAKQEAA